MHGATARQLHRRIIGVVGRVEYDDFVADSDEGFDRGEQGGGRARRDRDLGIRVRASRVHAFGLQGDLPPQLRHAGHRRVLVVAGAQMMRDAVEQRRGCCEIGKSLRQVDRFAVQRELGHDCEYGRAEAW